MAPSFEAGAKSVQQEHGRRVLRAGVSDAQLGTADGQELSRRVQYFSPSCARARSVSTPKSPPQ